MAVPVHRPERTQRDPPMVSFMKAGTDMRSLRFWLEDPRRLQMSFFGDDRFWLAHQADWYESTILPKGRITTEMKWVDWPCRMDLPGPATSVGTRTDYSVGPWDYPACATRHLKAWSTRTAQE
jgi:hypothetical protein